MNQKDKSQQNQKYILSGKVVIRSMSTTDYNWRFCPLHLGHLNHIDSHKNYFFILSSKIICSSNYESNYAPVKLEHHFFSNCSLNKIIK